jgi:membrane-associated phospholipid phosphatase
VAAIPSLHTAFAVLTCLVLLPLARRVWQRVLLVGYALLMPLVLVWSGEHYVIDTLLGALYAGGVVVAGSAARPALVAVRHRLHRLRPGAPPRTSERSSASTVDA